MNDFLTALSVICNEEGYVMEWNIRNVYDPDGGGIHIDNNEYKWLDGEEYALASTSNETLLNELKKRGYNVSSVNKIVAEEKGKNMEDSTIITPFYNTELDKMNISKRVYHCLRRAGINTMGDAVLFYKERGVPGLRQIRNIGEKTLAEFLNETGLCKMINKGEEGFTPIEYLSLSRNTISALKENGIKTKQDII